jgi:beta-lactamase class D
MRVVSILQDKVAKYIEYLGYFNRQIGGEQDRL